MDNETSNKINDIIKLSANIDIISIKKEHDHFFGNNIGIKARDLVAIIYAIEKQFKIRFTEEEIQSDKFYNMQGLSDLVSTKQAITEQN